MRWVIAAIALAWPSVASATWSIAAVDPQTGEVGVAVASCVEAPFGTTILPQVPALAPGIGALVAQAQFSQSTRDAAHALLLQGTAPQDVIDMVLAGDPLAQNRQYAVVDLRGMIASFTGSNAQDWAGHQSAAFVAAQGNILYGPAVVDDALAAFEAPAPRCPWTLADRLLVALEAGAAQGGDNRCSMRQSALAAVLVVAAPDDPLDAFSIDLTIPSQPQGGDNPVALLRAAYDAWRIDHPADPSGCDRGDSTSDDGGDTTSQSDGSTGAPPPPAPTTDADDDDAPPAGDDAPPSDDAASTGTIPQSGDDARGCGCATGGSKGASLFAWFVLLGLPCARRRGKMMRADGRCSFVAYLRGS